MLSNLFIGFLLASVVFVLFALFGDYARSLLMKREGFATNGTHDGAITPGGDDEISVLSPGSALSSSNEKLVESAALPAMSVEEAEANWGALTSEKCYRADIGESLKKTRNYLQRTNNYKRSHPDSCSAPSHELIGNFYKPTEGVGRYPLSGTHYPPSTQACPN